ncbi:MAG TPA: hypothetical protein VGB25_07995 [Candidatus Binatia bacterium]
MDALNDAWSRVFPFLRPYWDSLFLWRGVGLSLLALFVLCLLFRRPLGRWLSDDRSQQHDAALFRKSEEYVSHQFLDSFLNQQLAQRVCFRKDLTRLPRMAEEFNRMGNQFIDNEVGQAFDQLMRTLMRINGFVSQHFFQNTDEDRLELHPQLIDKKRFEGYAKDLNSLINLARGAYQNYRVTVKQQLKV